MEIHESPRGSENKKAPAESIMDWMMPNEVTEIQHVEGIREKIIEKRGLLDPAENIAALNYMAHYYAKNCDRLGRYEGMQRELFHDILIKEEKTPVSKAEAIAKGSEFGKRRVFYEHLTAGYLEIINTLKKTQEYWQNQAKNQF